MTYTPNPVEGGVPGNYIRRNSNKEMEVQIKLTKEQHDLLLDRLGSEESIREWLQHSLDRRMQEIVNTITS